MILPIAPRPAVIKHVKTRREFQWRESSTSVGIVSLTPLEFPHTGSVVIQYTREEGGGLTMTNSADVVERRPQTLGGHPLVKGTRVAVWVLKANYLRGMSVDELAEDYGLPVDVVQQALRWADPYSVEDLGAPVD
ncbi:DUF433 domain-containing protein [Sulfobacillus harzensis]|uniref:DUF433 domain-containing protein n=1 Tax=Sulfobacillus harzensis TaxID=2729629 RepID=A0A7Y0Q3D1_9FIRM|nr:DUF433 domain-containing protein [Sulfobacillus harzensis]NMP23432.1 DUF433 domain-containing protein [Sulfobacillus harzensis]